MLHLQLEDINIRDVSKVLARYNIRASITCSAIIFYSDVPDDLLIQLYDSINTHGVQDSLDIPAEDMSKESTIIIRSKVDKPKNAEATIKRKDSPNECKDMNMVQVQLLSLVDINELLKIAQSNFTDEVKVKKILDLFGFDFKKNGVQYLLKAIIFSSREKYFNVETLSKGVSETEGICKDEIKRLMVARVKETFCFRKAPTIDFIRLVNYFLKDGVYEKTGN